MAKAAQRKIRLQGKTWYRHDISSCSKAQKAMWSKCVGMMSWGTLHSELQKLGVDTVVQAMLPVKCVRVQSLPGLNHSGHWLNLSLVPCFMQAYIVQYTVHRYLHKLIHNDAAAVFQIFLGYCLVNIPRAILPMNSKESIQLGSIFTLQVGAWTDDCIISTAFHAFSLQYDVVLIEDGVSTASKQHFNAIEVMRGAAAKVLVAQDVVRYFKEGQPVKPPVPKSKIAGTSYSKTWAHRGNENFTWGGEAEWTQSTAEINSDWHHPGVRRTKICEWAGSWSLLPALAQPHFWQDGCCGAGLVNRQFVICRFFN